MRTILLAALLAVGASTVACDAPPGEDSRLGSVTRDSAGITVVENAKPAPETRLGWRIAEAPTLSVGAVEGDPEYQLFRVSDATRLPDGRIVIANTGSGELRVFDASGVHRRSFGGQGEGPGEFDMAAPSRVDAWPGDSIAASDTYARRFSVFDADGVHGRTLLVEEPYYRLAGVLPDGKLLLATVASFTAGTVEAGVVHREVEYGIAAPDGSLHADIGTHAGTARYVVQEDRGMAVFPYAFSHSTLTGVWGNLVLISPNGRYEIRGYGADGALARIVRRDHELRSPTQADLDDYLARRYAGLPEGARREAEVRLSDMPLVETFPAFSRILTDGLDHLWVGEYRLPGESLDEEGDSGLLWTVFDPEGRVQGLVETPADLSIFEIGEDYILGRVSDELGIERVQLWRLDRSDP